MDVDAAVAAKLVGGGGIVSMKGIDGRGDKKANQIMKI